MILQEFIIVLCSILLLLQTLYWILSYGVQKILRINARIWCSPEYAAFRECYADILTAIQSPEQLANRLYSQKVIHTDVHDEVHLDPQTKRKKSRILLLAVEQAIRTHPTNFQVLVDALHQEATSGMQTVCCRLERLYHCNVKKKSIKGTATPPRIPFHFIIFRISIAVTLIFVLSLNLWQHLLVLIVVTGIDYFYFRHCNVRTEKVLEVVQASNDSLSLQHVPIQKQFSICVSNYRPLQRVVTVHEVFARFTDLKLRKEEIFNPVVTVIDSDTDQPVHVQFTGIGEHDYSHQVKKLCCYLSVNVDVHPFSDVTHVAKKTHEVRECFSVDNEVALHFCFFQANSEYVVTFSVKHVTNAEGFECFGYRSNTFRCVLHTVSREQFNANTPDGIVMVKGMPLIEFSGPCVGNEFNEFTKRFLKLILQGNQCDAVIKLTTETTSSKQPLDLKVAALCFLALQLTRDSQRTQETCAILDQALQLSYKLECKNGLLLRGRIFRYYSTVHRQKGDISKALAFIDNARSAYFSAAPSYDTANLLCEEAALHEELLRNTMSEENRRVEQLWNLGIEHSHYVLDHERPVLCLMYTRKAAFHLKSFQVSVLQMHSLSYLRPTKQDIQIAESCLCAVPFDLLEEVSTYKVHYYLTYSDIHLWRNQYREAIAFAEAAKEQCKQSRLVDGRKMKLLNERLGLLAELEARQN